MLTLILQHVHNLTGITFALLSLLIARRIGERGGVEVFAWYVTGVVFAIRYGVKTLQEIVGSIAFFSGADAPIYSLYLAWAPAANHSRVWLTFGLYGALLFIGWKGIHAARYHRSFLLSMAGLCLFGGLVGWYEGSLVPARHFATIAASEALALSITGAVLFLAMFRPLMDRLLWACTAINGFMGVFTSLYLAALAWREVPGSWSPAPWQLQSIRVTFGIMIVIIAARRLYLAGKGVRVRNMLPHARASPPILLR